LNDEEKGALTPMLAHAISTGNRGMIDAAISDVTNQIKGYNQTIDTNLTAFSKAVTDANQQKIEVNKSILDYKIKGATDKQLSAFVKGMGLNPLDHNLPDNVDAIGNSITLDIPSGSLIDNPYTERDEGQCGAFVNDYLGFGVFGDSIEQKKNNINSYSPQAGAIAIFETGGNEGHVAIVESVNADGSMNIVESNFAGKGQVGRRRISQREAVGFYIPTSNPSGSVQYSTNEVEEVGKFGKIENDVQAVLEGRNTLYNIRQTMGRSNEAASYMSKMREAITNVDPNFDFVASDAGAKAVSAAWYQKAVSAVNNVLPNIDNIIKISNEADRSGLPAANKLTNELNFQLGNTTISSFRQAQQLIGDELGLALGAGAMSDMKLELGLNIVDPNLSPKQFAINMERIKEFLNNRKKSLTDLRYKSSTTSNSQGEQSSYEDYLKAIQ
jgi:hypothetical protein